MPASRAAAAALALALLLLFARAGAPVPAAAATRSEKPLPAFEGTTLDGKRLSVAELLGRRLLVLFVAPGSPEAAAIVAAARTVAPARGASHFEILVIAAGTDETALRALGADLPVLRDPQGAYGAQLGLRGRSAALLVDAEGYVVRGTELGGVPVQTLAGMAEGTFREWLRLPAAAGRRARCTGAARRARLRRPVALRSRGARLRVAARQAGGADLLPPHLPALPPRARGDEGTARRAARGHAPAARRRSRSSRASPTSKRR